MMPDARDETITQKEARIASKIGGFSRREIDIDSLAEWMTKRAIAFEEEAGISTKGELEELAKKMSVVVQEIKRGIQENDPERDTKLKELCERFFPTRGLGPACCDNGLYFVENGDFVTDKGHVKSGVNFFRFCSCEKGRARREALSYPPAPEKSRRGRRQ